MEELRAGLSESEASLLWAITAFGGVSMRLLSHLEPSSAELVKKTIDALPTDKSTRQEVLEVWKAQDDAQQDPNVISTSTSKPRLIRLVQDLVPLWKAFMQHELDPHQPSRNIDEGVRVHAVWLGLGDVATGPHRLRTQWLVRQNRIFDIGWFLGLDMVRVQRICTRIGIHQFVELQRDQGRRARARLLFELPGDKERAWFTSDLRRARELTSQEYERIGEVFVWLKERHTSWDELLFHMGLSFIVCGAGRRQRQRVLRLVDRWPKSASQVLLMHDRMHRSSARLGVELATQRALCALIPELWSDPDLLGSSNLDGMTHD